MATNTEKPNAKNLTDDNPKKTLDLSLPPTATPEPDPSQDPPNDSSTHPSSLPPPTSADASVADADADAKDGADSKASVDGHDAPVSDFQKKIRRAERFGISVQLSEQEKRNSRAERYVIFSGAFAYVLSEAFLFMFLDNSSGLAVWEPVGFLRLVVFIDEFLLLPVIKC